MDYALRASMDPKESHFLHTETGNGQRPVTRPPLPEVKIYNRRYFENPFISESIRPVIIDNTVYLEDAMALARSIYQHYSREDYEHADSDIYVGSAGVAYSFDKLIRRNLLPQREKGMFTGMALHLMDSALAKKGRDHGILTGYPGTFIVGAMSYDTAGNMEKSQACLQKYVDFCQHVDHLEVDDSSGDELFTGRSGFLAGFLELFQRFPDNQALLSVPIEGIIKGIIRSGERHSKAFGRSKESPLLFYHYGSQYLGAAHGASFILQTLLRFPQIISKIDGAEYKIKQSVEYILHQERHGNYPPQFGEHDDELVHWCHGAPGVIYMLAKAYLVWKDEKYLHACQRSADLIWEKGLLRKGPGICHGIAGNGYAFLLMYRLTGDTEYLYRAQRFADIMFHRQIQGHSRKPDHPFSLFEGIAGTICFLTDITQTTNAFFPFCDIFMDYILP